MTQTIVQVITVLCVFLLFSDVMKAQVPVVGLQVKFDTNIEGIRSPNEPEDKLNSKLSADLAESIQRSNLWFEFCWDLVPSHVGAASELVVTINKDVVGNWVMEVTLVASDGTTTRAMPMDKKVVRDRADLVAKGPQKPKLSERIGEWFTEHYLKANSKTLKENFGHIPVARSAIVVVQVGTEQLCAIEIPDRFGHFKYSQFRILCKQIDPHFSVLGSGVGYSKPSANRMVLLGLRPKIPTPPDVIGKEVVAYLKKFVDESEYDGALEVVQ